MAGVRKRLMAYFMARVKDDQLTVDRKHRLFKELSGTVLEIGPGTGPNLAYFPPSIRWIGVEPNPHMHVYLHQQAERLGLSVELRPLQGEKLPLEDASVDHVVSTLVLCSVPNQATTLAEILRVLKPGGRFVFFEHVAAPQGSRLRRYQRMLRPAWKWFGDGCHPDRETWATIESAGFREVQIEYFQLPEGPVAPHIAGYAIK